MTRHNIYFNFKNEIILFNSEKNAVLLQVIEKIDLKLHKFKRKHAYGEFKKDFNNRFGLSIPSC